MSGKTIRYRAGISTSTKGVKTPDCTVEITEVDDGFVTVGRDLESIEDEIVERTASLEKRLSELYPVEKEVK